MGIIRSSPNSQIKIKTLKLDDLNYLETSVCGWQHIMEDYTGYAKINQKLSVFYVIDGHNGPDIAELAAEKIPQILRKSQLINLQQYKAALQNLFQTLDDSLKQQTIKCSAIRQKYGLPLLVERTPVSGCSIVIALVGQGQITIANIGECKSYVCYSTNLSKAVLISGNHTQSNKEDQTRIKNAGGYFLNGRVNGMFPFTRSIGDFPLKSNQFLKSNEQFLISTPSIFSLRKQDIKLIVMGSSGVWQRANYVLKELTEDDLQIHQLQEKSKTLLQSMVCKNPKQSDIGLKNMALLVIDLKH